MLKYTSHPITNINKSHAISPINSRKYTKKIGALASTQGSCDYNHTKLASALQHIHIFKRFTKFRILR